MKQHIDQNAVWVNFQGVRAQTKAICAPLATEDYLPQPISDVSPPKWHLAHTTWFFEQFVLVPFSKGYQVYDADFAFLFNSYYNTLGDRALRQNRGFFSRPTVEEVYRYRDAIDAAMTLFFQQQLSDEVLKVIRIGLNHEQQHQELLAYDIKYILGMQPLNIQLGQFFPLNEDKATQKWIAVSGGLHSVGATANGFCFDNELPKHQVHLNDFEISNRLVTNAEYMAFVQDGGYKNAALWHAEGWDFIRQQDVAAPLYWKRNKEQWSHYTFNGLQALPLEAPVMHISFYEAFAFATWAGLRLPTEFEWEVANSFFDWGQLWEWTNSAYLPYPGFKTPAGALGEYNGKFMLNQNVLRGASIATPKGHERPTYRNFFHASARWIFSGLRLAK